MIRTALDSNDLTAFIPVTDFIFTYSDLVHETAAFEMKFPAQQVVYIDRALGDPGNKATIIDVEPGAYQVQQVVDWYEMKTRSGLRWLTHYSDRDNLPAIRQALGGRFMWQWLATLDGTMHIDGYAALRGPDLVQVASAAMTGLEVDFSVVLNPSWRPSSSAGAVQEAVNKISSAARTLSSVSGDLSAAIVALS